MPSYDVGLMLGLHVVITLVTAVAVRHADAAVLAVAAVLRRVAPRGAPRHQPTGRYRRGPSPLSTFPRASRGCSPSPTLGAALRCGPDRPVGAENRVTASDQRLCRPPCGPAQHDRQLWPSDLSI